MLSAPVWGGEEMTPAADTESGGLTFGQVIGLLAAAGVVSGGSFAVGKARSVKVEPNPLEVKPAPNFATKEDLKDAIERQGKELAALSERQDKFETEMRNLLRDSEKRSHARMDTISSQLGEITGMLKGMQYVNPRPTFVVAPESLTK